MPVGRARAIRALPSTAKADETNQMLYNHLYNAQLMNDNDFFLLTHRYIGRIATLPSQPDIAARGRGGSLQ